MLDISSLAMAALSSFTEGRGTYKNINHLWGHVMAETLFRMGLRHVVLSPGSRCTPMTCAFHEHPGIDVRSILDERSAGFFALGLAKATHTPVALVCTSGTAGAHYYPAIIEAKEQGVPLIALTADRPPEMQYCQSTQTIDQQKLFGDFTNWYAQLPIASLLSEDLAALRQNMVHAWERSLSPERGPVHINVPFRDPLAPVGKNHLSLPEHFDWEKFFTNIKEFPKPEMVLQQSEKEALIAEWQGIERGVITVGPSEPRDPHRFAQAVHQLSEALGWPVLADGLSPLRQFAETQDVVISQYDLILRKESLLKKLQPEAVISIGALPTSKVLRRVLSEPGLRTWVMTDRIQNVEGLHRNALPVKTTVAHFVEGLDAKSKQGDYYNAWVEQEEAARNFVSNELSLCDFSFEGKVPFILGRNLPDGTPVVIANSMPVRDVEYFLMPGRRHLQVISNRGVNGIDGTLSTAMGVAEGLQKPTVLVTGDLALLHDTNGWLQAQSFTGSLTVVLINNNGGGIFENLPIAQYESGFEEFFATPQAVDWKSLAQAYSIEYLQANELDWLTGAVRILPEKGIRLIELPTDRRRDTEFRKKLFKNYAKHSRAENAKPVVGSRPNL